MDVSERNCNDIIYISIKLLIFESLGERMMEEEIWSERVWNVVKIFVTFYLYAAGLRTREVKRRETKKKKTRQSNWRKQIHQRKITVEANLSSQILNVKVRHDRWVKWTNRRHQEENLVSFCRHVRVKGFYRGDVDSHKESPCFLE